MSDVTTLRAEVMRLPEHERAQLAASLLDSLPLAGFEEEALLDTARSRYNEIATNETEPVTWEMFAAMLKTLGTE